MLGVPLTCQRGVHGIWLTDGTTAWFWSAAERAAIAVVVFAPGLLPQITAVAARHSGLRLVLDYLALSGGIQDAAPGPAHRPALVLAQYPNVAVKATALPSYFPEVYPHPRLHTHCVVEAYGPQRVFWGTDLARLRGSYCQVITCRTEEMDFLSDIDTTWIRGRGIAEWLGWPLEAIRHTAEVKGVSWKPNVQFHSRLHRSRSRIGMA
jgi:hypothetical protein